MFLLRNQNLAYGVCACRHTELMHTTRENTAVTTPPPHCRRSEQSFPDSISLETIGRLASISNAITYND